MLLSPQADSPLRIRMVDFSPAEIKLFSAVLDLAEFGLDHDWQLSDEPKPDAYLLKKALGTEFACEPQSHCFNYSASTNGTADHTILYDETGIPLLHELIKQLNHASALPHSAQAQQESVKPAIDAPPTLPEHLLKADSPLAIHLGTEKVYVNPEQNSFYYPAPLEQLNPYLTPNADISIEAINIDELNELIKQTGLPAQPLKHLIWYTAFMTSDGTLIESLSEQDVIRLKDWPYLGVSSRHYIKLATYLKNHRACFADALKESGLAVDIAKNFYNASHLAGLIEAASPDDLQPTDSTPQEHLSFLDKIKNRLRH